MIVKIHNIIVNPKVTGTLISNTSPFVRPSIGDNVVQLNITQSPGVVRNLGWHELGIKESLMYY